MRRKGFTLVEIMIVVAIIALLAAIAIPTFIELEYKKKAIVQLEQEGVEIITEIMVTKRIKKLVKEELETKRNKIVIFKEKVIKSQLEKDLGR